MRSTYTLGDLVRVTGTLTVTATGDELDPDVVTFSVRHQAEDVTTYTYGTDAQLVKSATGVYYVDVNANAAGLWWYRFASTGNGQAAQEGSFLVERSKFA